MTLFRNSITDKEYIYVVGLMSGTSLDGLDIALCSFPKDDIRQFSIHDAITVKYDDKMKNKLQNAGNMSSYEFLAFHREYGEWTGKQINNFLKNKKTNADLIASHGHTVFHEPENKLNFQIGDGAVISAITGITTVSDFRSFDIILGGQGAPLIPVADRDLFNSFDACINIGGFANVSLDHNGKRIAWDICPANFILNQLSEKLGFEFDKNGENGRKGKIITKLLQALENIDYYHSNPPKSLGAEWSERYITPLLQKYSSYNIHDILRTFYEHIALRISEDLNRHKVSDSLFTGGGAKNVFLIELITQKVNGKVIIPDSMIIDYKEALGFAYLGLLRILEINNTLASVTGAKQDSVSGIVYLNK